MALDSQIQEIINQTKAANNPPLSSQTLKEIREAPHRLKLLAIESESVAEITNLSIPGEGGAISIRLYHPSRKQPLPMLIYFHPGGYVKGDIESHDPLYRAMANSAEVIVIAVDYRLAPEHPYPAALEDGYSALKWAEEHGRDYGGDPKRIAVGGESSGGNLAAALAILARDRGGPHICYQALIYPPLDYTNSLPSHKEFREGYLLDEDSILWYASQYVPEGVEKASPLISPLFVENVEGLPPTLLLTCGYDPLRDEGEAYADKLKKDGIPTKYHCYKGMAHGFFQLSGVVDEGRRAITSVGNALKAAIYK